MKYILFIISFFLVTQSFSQDSTITVYNDQRGNWWIKKHNVPAWQIDGYNAIIRFGDTLVRARASGIFTAEELNILPDGSDMSSELNTALDLPFVRAIEITSDSSRPFLSNSDVSANGKTLIFKNGCYLSGSFTLDLAVISASYRDKIFDTSVHFTNAMSATNYWSPMWAGAAGDGVTDDVGPLKATFNIQNIKIDFPRGDYYVTDSLKLDWSSITVMDYGSRILSATTDRPGVIIGSYDPANLVAMRGQEFSLRIERVTQSNWDDTLSIGVKVVNSNYSRIKIMECNKFSVGLKTVGHNAGVAYVNYILGEFERNGTHIWVASESPNSLAWNNQNTYTNGWLRNGSENPGKKVIGVKIGNGNYAVTNNIFTETSFEMARLTAYCVEIVSGTRNQFLNFRTEDNSDTVVIIHPRTGSGQTSNGMNYFYAARDGGVENPLLDSSLSNTNFYESADRVKTQRSNFTTVWELKDIASMCIYPNAADSSVNIAYPGLFMPRTGSSYPVSTLLGPQVIGDYIQIDEDHRYTVTSDMIDVSVVKQYTIKHALDSTSDMATLYLSIFDKNGVNITSTSYIQSNLSYTYTTTYAGAIYSTVQLNRDVSITLPKEAKTMRVGFGQSSSNIVKLKAVKVTTYQYGASSVLNVYNNPQQFNISPSMPVIGSYMKGKIIYNSDPKEDSARGWICSASGTIGATLSGVTGTISNGTNKLVLNSGSGALLQKGQWLNLNSNPYRIIGLDADTAYIGRNLTGGTITGGTINYAVATFIAISSGGDNAAIMDSLSAHNIRITALEEIADTEDTAYLKNAESAVGQLVYFTPNHDTAKIKVITVSGDLATDSTEKQVIIKSRGNITFTPTFGDVLNYTSATLNYAFYTNNDSTIDIQISVQIESDAADTDTEFTITNPIAAVSSWGGLVGDGVAEDANKAQPIIPNSNVVVRKNTGTTATSSARFFAESTTMDLILRYQIRVK